MYYITIKCRNFQANSKSNIPLEALFLLMEHHKNFANPFWGGKRLKNIFKSGYYFFINIIKMQLILTNIYLELKIIGVDSI